MKKEYAQPKLIVMGSMVKITQGGVSPTSTLDNSNSSFDASSTK